MDTIKGKKNLMIIILLFVSFTSCQKYIKLQKPDNFKRVYSININEDFTAFKYPNGTNAPNDETVYQNVLKLGKSQECAQLYSYCRTSIEQVRLIRNDTNFEYFEYKSCKAVKSNDSIQISFRYSPIGGGDIVYFESKPIDLYITNSKFQIEIVHRTCQINMKLLDGQENIPQEQLKYTQVPFPRSQIEYVELTLDKDNYSIGDSINGYIYARSTFLEKYNSRKRKDTTEDVEKEIVKGFFRVILEDPNMKCSNRYQNEY